MNKDTCTNHQWCDVHHDNHNHIVEHCDEHNPHHNVVRHSISICEKTGKNKKDDGEHSNHDSNHKYSKL
jgi:hypothetical protein